jgi:uncharacterized protein (DUF433 family)
MPATIIDRGRGPEIAGTRVTVFRVMDYLRENALPDRIAEDLRLTRDELQAALKYIADNRAGVEADYDALLRRLEQQRSNAANGALEPDELKQRILARRENATHAGPPGQ